MGFLNQRSFRFASKFKLIPMLVLASLGGVIAVQSIEAQSQAQLETKTETVPVSVKTVQQLPYAKLVISSGTVRPVSEQKLAFKVAGVVDQVLVNEGEPVKKGQLLAVLALDEIDAQVAKAQVVLSDAKRQLKRVNALKDKQLLSDEQSKQAKTAMQVAQNDLNIATFNRKYAVIKAPRDGRILTRQIEPHELIGVGQQAFVFADESQGWQVQLSVADIDVVKLQLGDDAQIRLDAYPNQVFHGNIREIAGRADAMSQTFSIGVKLTDAPTLLSGLIAHTSIKPSKTQPLTPVPLTALMQADDSKAKLYVLNEKGQPELKTVQLAFLEDGNAMVSKGLAKRQKVIVQGGLYLFDGATIDVVEME